MAGPSTIDAAEFCPADRHAWRAWLQDHHRDTSAIWLVHYRVHTGIPSLSWSEAVDEALCFGWIDSRKQTLDAHRYRQLYTPRKPTSAWSRVNKEKVRQLIAAGRMLPAGSETIRKARENGSWNLLDDVEALVIPPDLSRALADNPEAARAFHELSASRKKFWLHGLLVAKRAETREKRIRRIIDACSPSGEG